MSAKLLIVDDNINFLKSTQEYFQREGYHVAVAKDGIEALEVFESIQPEIVILDVQLPHKNGRDVCRFIRQKAGNKVGIIIISEVATGWPERTIGYEIGADHYLEKPFELRELYALISRLKQRLPAESTRKIQGWLNINGYLRIDFELHKVEVGGKDIEITPTEFKLLQLLVNNPGKPFTRSEIGEHIWAEETFVTDSQINTHIARLRAKIEQDTKEYKYIISIHGVGYKFIDFIEEY